MSQPWDERSDDEKVRDHGQWNDVPQNNLPKEEITNLPVIAIKVQGKVTKSNLPEFQQLALAAIGNIKRDLVTDDDFGHCEKVDLKLCERIEDIVKVAVADIISQSSDVNAVVEVLRGVGEEARKVRLEMEKKVKERKADAKAQIIREANNAWNTFLEGKQQEFPQLRLAPLIGAPDFEGVIKGKRTTETAKAALKEELEIRAGEAIVKLREFSANLSLVTRLSPNEQMLFSDLQQIISYPPADFQRLVDLRLQQASRTPVQPPQPIMPQQPTGKIVQNPKALVEDYMKKYSWGDFESKVRWVLNDFISYLESQAT